MDLDSVATRAGVRHVAHETTASTNADALALARRGELGPLWVTARMQSAGRGRRGREWISRPGNLFATLLLVDPCPPECAPQLSFVAALAVHDAVIETATALGPHLALKWPNDVLCDGAKLAGILIEGEGTATVSVAVGIGVNCAQHPEGTEYPSTDLASAGVVVAPETLFRALSRVMLTRLAQWNRGDGFAAIRADWMARAAGLGRPIRVRLGDRAVDGSFEALDPVGRLLLRRADGAVETIAAGDVFPLVTAAES